MNEMNYEKFLSDLVKPLVLFPEEVVVKILSDIDHVITIQVMVNAEDLGRVIGKKGRVVNAIRTLMYAGASKFGKKIEISVDSF